MSEDLSRRDTAPAGGRPTGDWIRTLADAEGLTPEEMVERMVASYWTLKEMDGMMEQIDIGSDAEPSEAGATGQNSVPPDGTAELLQELTDRVGQLEDDRESVERRVIEEFGYLRTILDHLIERTEALQAAQASQQARAAQERHRDEDAKQLIELKRAASRHGVSRAACGQCGTQLEIGPLPTPDCPECRRSFASLQPSDRRFGRGTDVLTVADP